MSSFTPSATWQNSQDYSTRVCIESALHYVGAETVTVRSFRHDSPSSSSGAIPAKLECSYPTSHFPPFPFLAAVQFQLALLALSIRDVPSGDHLLHPFHRGSWSLIPVNSRSPCQGFSPGNTLLRYIPLLCFIALRIFKRPPSGNSRSEVSRSRDVQR